MEEALEFEVGGCGGFAAVARRLGGKGVFGAGAELLNVPGEIGGADVFGYAFGETLGERDHFFEGGGREDVFRVARIAARESALPASVPPMPPTSQSSS